MITIRAICLLVSLLVHALLAVLLLSSVRFPVANPDLLTVDLTHIESPPAIPEATPQPPLPEPKTPPADQPPPAPQPRIAPEDLPPQPLPEQPAQEAPAPQAPAPPAQTALNEAPSPIAPELPQDAVVPEEAPAEPEVPAKVEPEVDSEGRTIIRVGSVDGLAHRGHEGRFGRSLLADFYSYSPDEFAGQFVTAGGRSVSIIDARKTEYGRFLLYDSKLGSLRRLKKFNKYIYTIGPSLTEDEPIMGSVTFLAKDDRIERFIYMPNDDTKALFPGKIHFREHTLSVPSCGVRIKSMLTLPKKERAPVGILVHGSGCLPLEAIQGAARALVSRDVGAAAFVPRGCTSCGEPVQGGLEEDAYRSLRLIRRQKGVNPERIGYIGIDAGIPEALKAASREGAAFFAGVYTQPKAPLEQPTIQAVRKLAIPSLWIFPQWGDGYTKLWNIILNEKKISPTITLRKTTRDDRTPLGNTDAQGNWVLRFSATDAAAVADWVESIEPAP